MPDNVNATSSRPDCTKISDIKVVVENFAARHLDPEEYIKCRVSNGIGWYRDEADSARSRYLVMRIVAVLFAAFVPVVLNLSTGWPYQNYVVTVLSLVVVIAVSLEGVLHYKERWRTYRSTSSALEHEFFAYQTGAPPYDKHQDATGRHTSFDKFVRRVETLIAHEVESTLSVMTPTNEQNIESATEQSFEESVNLQNTASELMKKLDALSAKFPPPGSGGP